MTAFAAGFVVGLVAGIVAGFCLLAYALASWPRTAGEIFNKSPER